MVVHPIRQSFSCARPDVSNDFQSDGSIKQNNLLNHTHTGNAGFLFIVLLAIGATSVSATNYAKFNLLKDDRAAGRLVFPPTTLAQKEVILSNVENALAIWASYDSKKAKYGSAADPFPTIKDLRENIKTITDEELQLGLTDAFAMIRDQHTRWTNMAPYSCFYATTEVEFTFIEGDADITKNPTVVVTSTAKHPILRPSLGRITPRSKLEMNCLQSMDCPLLGGSSRTSSNMVLVPMNLVDSALLLNILLRYMGKSTVCRVKTLSISSSNPELTPEQLYCQCPYVSGRDEECWDLGSKLYKSLPSRTLPGTPEASLPVSAKQPGHSHESDTAHLSPRVTKWIVPRIPKERLLWEDV
ncbi:hypothetical protein BASA50_000578 [Batrachochytrium salamandrivorans]|uniref:Uncharacterized protein n=1 Tax=Batrachochytrium salamandrivorans TaxID=1357716 RepID=A0ABQ8ETK7_9FUNG|nr:hypothetical protein BASA50_000578 [Batrachochytrium salamandrivorans]